MQVFVTGAAGFIGSHLCHRLLKEGHTVVGLDNFSTGRAKNLRSIRNHPQFSLHRGVVQNQKLVKKLMDPCDMVYHLAATVGVQNVVQRPLETITNECRSTEVVLECATPKKKKVVFTSSSEVYGKSQALPFREDGDLTIGPPDINRWSYACAKAQNEFLAMAYHREKKLPMVIIRCFNIVGPHQVGTFGMVIPRFFKAALAHRPIQVYGDGKQKRCFTYIDDVVEALIRLGKSRKALGKVVNVGNNQEISILNLAKKIKKLTASRSKIEFVPYEKRYGRYFEDMKRRIPDLKRLAQYTGFTPKHSMDRVLKLTYQFYQAHPQELK